MNSLIKRNPTSNPQEDHQKSKKVLKPCLVNKKIVKIKKIHFGILTHELINQEKPTSSPQKDHQKSQDLTQKSQKNRRNLLRACSAENLLETSLQIIFLNRSLASGETFLKTLGGNLKFPLTTASKISSTVSP